MSDRQDADTHHRILDIGQRWAAAEQAGDVAALDALLDTRFVGVGPRGFVLPREQWIARYQSGDLRNESFRLDEATVRDYGDSAIAVARVTQTAYYRRQENSGEFRASLHVVRHSGRWLLAGCQLSGPIPQMPPP